MADLGDTLFFRADVYDSDSPSASLANANSVALTISLPDGTTVTPTVTNPPAVTGKYAYNYVTSLLSPTGRYVGQWVFSFVGGASTSYVETFDVGPSLVTVDEALAHLRASSILTSEPDLDQLQWLCMVASEAVEADLGRAIMPRIVVESHDGGGSSIILRKTPVLSVSSVTEGGVAVSSVAGYVLQILADGGGILHRGSQMVPQSFWYGRQNVVVTYTAGYLNPPRVIRKVALNAIEGMWQSSQQASHPALEDFAEGAVEPAVAALTSLEFAAYNSYRVHM